MRDTKFPSPAASIHPNSFPQAGSHVLHPGVRRRFLAAAALVGSCLAPAAASGAGISAQALLPLAPHLDCMAVQQKFPDKPTQDAPAKTDTPRPEGNSVMSRFGLAFRTSTLGLGADAGIRIARPVNVRVGFSSFHYTRTLTSDGVPYHGALRLHSFQTIVDWFPFSRSFHVSPGVLFFNGNRVTAVATPPVGQILTAGPEAFVSDPQNPIRGNAKSATRKVAPMVLAGFGNLVPHNRHFGYSVDFGVVFQGAPKSTFTLAGGACDPSGEFCARATEDSSIQAEAKSAQNDLDHHVRFLKYYPVMSVEFGYRF